MRPLDNQGWWLYGAGRTSVWCLQLVAGRAITPQLPPYLLASLSTLSGSYRGWLLKVRRRGPARQACLC